MTLFQHIPTFVSGVKPKSVHGPTLADVMSADFVKDWQIHPGFKQFSQSHTGLTKLLMVEFNDGKFFVAGYFSGTIDEPLDLPVWTNPQKP